MILKLSTMSDEAREAFLANPYTVKHHVFEDAYCEINLPPSDDFFDHSGEIGLMIIFFPIEKMVLFSDEFSQNEIDSIQPIQVLFNSNFEFAGWNTMSVGNLANICLHSCHPEVREEAERTLNKLYVYVESLILTHFLEQIQD